MNNDCAEVIKLFLDGLLVLGTFVLAAATVFLFWETRNLYLEAKDSSRRQLGVNTWLHFTAIWDTPDFRKHRRNVAALIRLKRSDHLEPVLDFFEQLGTTYRLKCIEEQLTYSSFNYVAVHWWEVLSPVVNEIRREMGDQEMYCEFEGMVNEMRKTFPKSSKATEKSVKDFLREEEALMN